MRLDIKQQVLTSKINVQIKHELHYQNQSRQLEILINVKIASSFHISRIPVETNKRKL